MLLESYMPTARRGHKKQEFKPGNPDIKGRNYDASVTYPVKFHQLREKESVQVGVGNRYRNTRTINQPQERGRFYREQAGNIRAVGNYPVKPAAIDSGLETGHGEYLEW